MFLGAWVLFEISRLFTCFLVARKAGLTPFVVVGLSQRGIR